MNYQFNSPNEVLQAILDFFQDSSKWVKYAYACDENYEMISIRDPKATCFCLKGLLNFFVIKNMCSLETMNTAEKAINMALYNIGFNKIRDYIDTERFNDLPFTNIQSIQSIIIDAKNLAK